MNEDLQRAVQWFPGHMGRTMRLLGERIALVDVVIDAIDARVIASGGNPMLDELAAKRQRITVFTRNDLADPNVTAAWLERFREQGRSAYAIDARDKRGITLLRDLLNAIATPRGTARVMIVGIPNAGKSSIINALIKRTAARAENRAGVTRSLQWFRVNPKLELLDTPGVLVPKITTPQAQWKLALVGAVPRERYDPFEVCTRFAEWCATTLGRTDVPDVETFARARGLLRKGGHIDEHNAALAYLTAYNEGTFGAISLEHPLHA
ncbi:MAG: ribosome biogenesis GTPase YlqF [Vulcanimicrobiaceae bacterium]